MRSIGLALLLAGCVGSPAGPNTTADQAPPVPPGPDANAYRAAIEANEAPFRVPGNVTAHLNEEVRIGDMLVRPVEVLEDSRCPIDATCVWAGRVRVRVAVSGSGELFVETGRPATVSRGARLTLVAVAPPNWARPPAGVDPNEPKRFAFRLSGMD